MKPNSIVTLIAATLLGVGTAYWLGASEGRRPWPKPTPPPPPSPIYTPSRERAPTSEEIAHQAREHNQRLVLEIRRALATTNAGQRETAFTFLLPELLQVDPARVAAMVARQEPGEARDTLRTEVVRQWIARDAPAAIAWMKTLDADERRASAVTAVAALAAHDLSEAIQLAEAFGVGQEDGSLEYLAQRWATEDLHAATRWIEAQPPGPKTDQLRARIELVRDQAKASRN
ncbi:MAG: hypothetical protein ABI769_05865 [Pseudomonadota bacterium]